MNDKLKAKICNIVGSVMDIEINSLDENLQFSSIPKWDSFNNLMLISKFQDEFNIEFTAVEIESTKRIKDLFILIERKTSNLNQHI